MTRNKFALFSLGLLICLAFIRQAAAEEIIDDIILKPGANGEVNLEIKFAVPVQYVRHFPQKPSPNSTIFFNILSSVPKSQWQSSQAHRAPPSDLVRDMTISVMDPGTGPKIQLDFTRPAQFTVTPGKNGQSLMLHITAEMPPKSNAKPGTSVPVVIPAVVAPVTGANVKPATPPTPASAPIAASAPAAAATTAPSGEVTTPKLVLPPSQAKQIHIPLGGKDGLPPFPDIDQVAPQAGQPTPPAGLSAADQLKRANDQAAVLMAQGGNALLAGQAFLAIESFNNVLALPPNKYSEDAQLWIGIARERIGQLPKAILEYRSYSRLYSNGKYVKWVNDRLALLKISAPAVFAQLDKSASVSAAPPVIVSTPFQTREYGSLAMYYYTGASRTTTTGGIVAQAPTTITRTDQRSIMTNVNMTASAYNNEYDNRLVFQDFYAANLLPNQTNSNRLGAAFYELKDRIEGYSARIGRQSGVGGGVMGRFDGISAGVDVFSNYRVNAVAGRLSDVTLDSKPRFVGTSVDFGTKSPFGGSLYAITQTADGLKDRQAVGGNLRYFNPQYNVMSMFDYDTQFKALNFVTVQGAYLSGGSGNDYNFIFDHRRSPILDIRNAINGTVTPITTLIQNGWTVQDLLQLANQRTGTTSTLSVGMTNHLNEKWNAGTDLSIAKNSGMPASGTLLPDGSVGLEGFVPAIPATPNVWTISERFTGNGVFRPHDITNFIGSYSKGPTTASESFQIANHSDLQSKWSLDLNMSLTHQSDNTGGSAIDISPTSRLTYRMQNNFSLDGQLGLDMARFSNAVLQTTTTTYRYFVSFGFQWNF